MAAVDGNDDQIKVVLKLLSNYFGSALGRVLADDAQLPTMHQMHPLSPESLCFFDILMWDPKQTWVSPSSRLGPVQTLTHTVMSHSSLVISNSLFSCEAFSFYQPTHLPSLSFSWPSSWIRLVEVSACWQAWCLLSKRLMSDLMMTSGATSHAQQHFARTLVSRLENAQSPQRWVSTWSTKSVFRTQGWKLPGPHRSS